MILLIGRRRPGGQHGIAHKRCMRQIDETQHDWRRVGGWRGGRERNAQNDAILTCQVSGDP